MLRRFPEISLFIKEMNEEGKLIAAICHGGWLLVSADVLKEKKATCFFAIKDDIINAGAEFIDDTVVVDGNLITSRNPYDLPFFCKEIIKFLKPNRD
jgi:protease I